MRDWWNDEPTVDDAPRLKWVDVLKQWNIIQLDLHETFGVDTESGILRDRTWWWLHDRITDLINKPSRLRAALDIPATATT